jgi:hypothetical protein
LPGVVHVWAANVAGECYCLRITYHRIVLIGDGERKGDPESEHNGPRKLKIRVERIATPLRRISGAHQELIGERFAWARSARAPSRETMELAQHKVGRPPGVGTIQSAIARTRVTVGRRIEHTARADRRGLSSHATRPWLEEGQRAMFAGANTSERPPCETVLLQLDRAMQPSLAGLPA